MSDCKLGKFDARFSVLADDVASDIGVALTPLDDDAVIATRLDEVLPDFGRAELRPVRACDLDAVLMAPLDFVLDNMRLVVVNLDANVVQVELVSDDLKCHERMVSKKEIFLIGLHLLGHQGWWKWRHSGRN